jgi:hypothetical protein
MQAFYIRRITGSQTRRQTFGGGNPDVEQYAPNSAVDPLNVAANADGARLPGVQGALNVTIDPAHRSACAITAHYKTHWDVIMLYAIDQTNEALGDATELVFDQTFSERYDLGYDIQKLGTPKGAPVLFTLVGEKSLIINKMNYPVDVTTVPLGFYAEKNNHDYRIKMAEMPTGWQVYLEDKLTGSWHNLSASDYSFKNSNDFRIERFVLHFSMKTTLIEPAKPGVIAWGTQTGIELHFDDIRSLQAEVVVSNLIGQVVYINNAVSTSTNFVIPISNNDPQVYIVTVLSEELTETLKVVR